MSSTRIPVAPRLRSVLRPLALAAACALPLAAAATQSWTFSGTIATVDEFAPGYPVALAGLAVGSPISGVLSYDIVPAPRANPFGGIFALATLYTTANFTFTLTTALATLDTWTTAQGLNVFVWNNQTLVSGVTDGLLMSNTPFAGNPLFQIGNLLYPTTTFSSTALPQATVPGGALVTVSLSNGQPWFQGQFTNLVFNTSPVPEPAPAALMAAGAALLAWRRLRPGAPAAA